MLENGDEAVAKASRLSHLVVHDRCISCPGEQRCFLVEQARVVGVASVESTYQQVRLRNPWATFARDFVAARHVNHVNGVVSQFAGKVCRQVVSPGLPSMWMRMRVWKCA